MLDELRIYFETNILDDKGSPPPSPQGEPQAFANTLRPKELKPVSASALPPTASVSPQGFTALRLTHVSAPGKPMHARTRVSRPSARPTGSREEKPTKGQVCPLDESKLPGSLDGPQGQGEQRA